MPNRLITIAIHTYDRAIALKALLQQEGVEVTLQNVNLDHPVVSSGIRVRIKESDLPMALRIIENPEIFDDTHVAGKEADEKNARSLPQSILVPVDFSDHSLQACRLAFSLAGIHKSSIAILHSYINPSYADTLQLTDTLNFDPVSQVEQNMEEQSVAALARREGDKFMEKIRSEIKSCQLPAVKFSLTTVEGLPEESINQWAKDNKPMMIVMSTRDCDKKEREMVGSVTAEVLDTCRSAIFTVPETVKLENMDSIHQVVFLCNVDQDDILALDTLYRLLPKRSIHVTLANIPWKRQRTDNRENNLERLLSYCREHYPDYSFDMEHISPTTINEDFSRICGSNGQQCIDIIAVPNKKKNALARLFNPGIAHRLLFHSDIPMLVIPV